MTYTVGRQRRISKRVQNIQEQEDARFWKQTWPELKSNGWSHDHECGGFYPPEAQKFHAAKRRRLGSDHKNFFKDINELKTYLSSNPFLYVANNEGTVVVNGSGSMIMPYKNEGGKVASSSCRTTATTTTTSITTSPESVAPTTDSAKRLFNSPQKCSERGNKLFSRSPSSVAAPTAMESTMEFINQNKRVLVDQKDSLLLESGPSVLNLPPNASINLGVLSNKKPQAGFDVRSDEKLTKGKKSKKKSVKSLKFRGPGRPKGSKSITDRGPVKKIIKEKQRQKKEEAT